ncbi:hypothetical protein [Paenibacillus crassostreae]|uniref:Lipoprotein n=1 Tax=Paenibacillus crassostreae TaxID=1763538 RepID=A0A167FC38_9BACL|nr:hypothetical protein [Paenibacillus crassostreae]AOZ90836.1 hypothetical protein LPB68_00530 [Paenibacillus crassostreae]OAB76398.1 hypothetical protein PNBC_03005 [Paenibacillus crassostreae]
MKKSLFIILLTLVFVVSCQSSDNVGQEIEANLNKIINNKEIAHSSNPNDYIKQNQNEYDNIISKDEQGLEYLIENLKTSKEDGLKEWIMAKACNDILKSDNPIQEWSTGKEWINKYMLQGQLDGG